MDENKTRPSMEEINAEMDAIKKRRPTEQQIENLCGVFVAIDDEGEDSFLQEAQLASLTRDDDTALEWYRRFHDRAKDFMTTELYELICRNIFQEEGR